MLYSFGWKTIKYPMLHSLFHTYLYSKHIQNLIIFPPPLLPPRSLRKAHKHLTSMLEFCHNLPTGGCSVSTFASLQGGCQKLDARGSFQNAGQIVSRPLLTQSPHPRPLLDPPLSSPLNKCPLCCPSEKRTDLLEEDLHELQVLLCIPTLVPRCLVFSFV